VDDQRRLEQEWIRAIAKQRDRNAFRLLFERYAPKLKAVFVRMGHQAQAAEDLVQEVMLSVWRRADAYNPDRAAVSTWIFTITKNRGIDQHRRRALPVADAQDPCFVASDAPALDSALAERERQSQLHDALSRLPPEQAEIVQAAFFHQQSMTEIAAAKDLPVGTVKSRLRRAIQRLRGRVDGDAGEPEAEGAT
jgi:RNA polymerase sigma-70 factor (ECF subfamily)